MLDDFTDTFAPMLALAVAGAGLYALHQLENKAKEKLVPKRSPVAIADLVEKIDHVPDDEEVDVCIRIYRYDPIFQAKLKAGVNEILAGWAPELPIYECLATGKQLRKLIMLNEWVVAVFPAEHAVTASMRLKRELDESNKRIAQLQASLTGAE